MTDTLTLLRPDDWHIHLRDGAALGSVVPHTAAVFARAIVMPNLPDPVTTAERASAYRQRILDARPDGSEFTPLMTLYLTNATTPDDIDTAADDGVTACKLYPAGATTNSDKGVNNVPALDPVLRAMARRGMPLLVHGEVVDPHVDVFDREAEFIEQVLGPLVTRHCDLRVVFEHITTARAVEFVRAHAPQVAATITPQHLMLNRNALFEGGLRPHHYCLPVLKRETDREALVGAAVSGEAAFFLGTDSAPHAIGDKQSACGCAGIYSAHAALEFYAEVFDAHDALDRLEAFASLNGPAFYDLPVNTDTVTLRRTDWPVPESYPFGDSTLVPFRAGGTLGWRCDEARTL
ncbi:MAG: dihydroorotase [Pseudomonadota bacterium]